MKRKKEKLSYLKLIIFDLDGTLVDAYKAIQSALNYVRRNFNLKPIAYKKAKQSVGMGDRNFIKNFFPPHLISKALEIYRKRHSLTLIEKAQLMPYSEEILSYLKHKGYYLAIASNRPTKFTKLILKHLDIDKYFDYILCADKSQELKPNPKILFKIINKFELASTECIYIGDMVIDVETARKAGIKSIIVATGSSSYKEIKQANPFLIVSNLRELRNIL